MQGPAETRLDSPTVRVGDQLQLQLRAGAVIEGGRVCQVAAVRDERLLAAAAALGELAQHIVAVHQQHRRRFLALDNEKPDCRESRDCPVSTRILSKHRRFSLASKQ